MARFPNDEYQSLLANAAVADTAAGDSDVPESTGGAEPVGAAAQSPATYGTRSIDLVTDTKVVDPEPDVPTTWWSKMLALGFGILVWLGLANPPTTGLEKPDLSGPAPEAAPLSHKPTKYKILALVCSCLLSIGSHYASQMLSGLQSTLLEVRGTTTLYAGFAGAPLTSRLSGCLLVLSATNCAGVEHLVHAVQSPTGRGVAGEHHRAALWRPVYRHVWHWLGQRRRVVPHFGGRHDRGHFDRDLQLSGHGHWPPHLRVRYSRRVHVCGS